MNLYRRIARSNRRTRPHLRYDAPPPAVFAFHSEELRAAMTEAWR